MKRITIERAMEVLSRINYYEKIITQEQPFYFSDKNWSWKKECEKKAINRFKEIFNKLINQSKFEL